MPAAVAVVSEPARTVVYAAASAQNTATSRSSAVGEVRAAISAVTSWNGNASIKSAELVTTTTTLIAVRSRARSTSSGEPTARPIPKATIGPISGEISMAPITTAVLESASPSEAIPMARRSWSQ